MVDIEIDGYILHNLAWHISNVGSVAELGGLMTDFGWTKFRVNDGDILELVNDIGKLLAALRTENASRMEENALYNGIQAIREAVSLSVHVTRNNPRECEFQLYSRLWHLKNSSAAVNKYLKSIEDWNEKPWMRLFQKNSIVSERLRLKELLPDEDQAVPWTPDSKKLYMVIGKMWCV